jgi:hypothetical protein
MLRGQCLNCTASRLNNTYECVPTKTYTPAGSEHGCSVPQADAMTTSPISYLFLVVKSALEVDENVAVAEPKLKIGFSISFGTKYLAIETLKC